MREPMHNCATRARVGQLPLHSDTIKFGPTAASKHSQKATDKQQLQQQQRQISHVLARAVEDHPGGADRVSTSNLRAAKRVER